MIVAGFGFRKAATSESLADALRQAQGVRGEQRVTAFATAADKARAPVFVALAERHVVRLLAIDATALARQETATHSDASLAARGTGSLAEAAALAGAGQDARLIVARVVSGDGMATCALAKGDGT